jgi:hypothetical protein
MAAAATTFTVRVKNMAGDILSIDGMDGRDDVLRLKNKIINKLGKKINIVIRLTYLDNTPQGFTELMDFTTLNSYPIDYTNDILNLFIQSNIITHPISSNEKLKWQLKYSALMEPIPPGTTVIHSITDDMVGKIIYILADPNAENGIRCAIVKIDVHPRSLRPLIQIEVIKEEEILTVMVAGNNQITKALQNNRVRLLDDSAEGGRRKKRARKRTLCRRRRTHRKHHTIFRQ